MHVKRILVESWFCILRNESEFGNPKKLATQGTKYEEKHNTLSICVGYHYTQTNTNNVIRHEPSYKQLVRQWFERTLHKRTHGHWSEARTVSTFYVRYVWYENNLWQRKIKLLVVFIIYIIYIIYVNPWILTLTLDGNDGDRFISFIS